MTQPKKVSVLLLEFWGNSKIEEQSKNQTRICPKKDHWHEILLQNRVRRVLQGLCSTFLGFWKPQFEEKLRDSRKNYEAKKLMGIKFIIGVACGVKKVCVVLFGFLETSFRAKIARFP